MSTTRYSTRPARFNRVQVSILQVAKSCGIRMKDTHKTEAPCWCPFCGSNKARPTASINKDRGLFHCFRCGEGFNSLGLYCKITGASSREAYEELRNYAA